MTDTMNVEELREHKTAMRKIGMSQKAYKPKKSEPWTVEEICQGYRGPKVEAQASDIFTPFKPENK